MRSTAPIAVHGTAIVPARLYYRYSLYNALQITATATHRQVSAVNSVQHAIAREGEEGDNRTGLSAATGSNLNSDGEITFDELLSWMQVRLCAGWRRPRPYIAVPIPARRATHPARHACCILIHTNLEALPSTRVEEPFSTAARSHWPATAERGRNEAGDNDTTRCGAGEPGSILAPVWRTF